MRATIALLSLVACGGAEPPEPPTLDDPVVLEPPDLTGVDLPAAFAEAFELIAAVDVRAAWAAHGRAIRAGQPGCPDLYLGNPDVENIDIRTRGKGLAWMDYCQQGDGTIYSGFTYWEDRIVSDGDETTALGKTVDASRLIFADGAVSRGDAMLFELVGTASDALSRTTAPDVDDWTYTSLVEGTVTGSYASDAGAVAGGYRTDLYRRTTGGSAQNLESRGNLFLFEHRISGRFDSLAVDLELTGPAGAGPNDCTAEPTGWIAIRDEDAFWYDLVFEARRQGDPQDPDYENQPYEGCDGCGTLYVRGLEQPGLEVCVDLGFLWEGALTPPPTSDFALILRDLGEAR
jgi:hypothetical protein